MERNLSDFPSNITAASLSYDGWFEPYTIRLVSNIFYSTILSIGVFGNIMVIMVIFKKKDMRSSTYIFLANLAIIDIMVLFVWGSVALLKINQKWAIFIDKKNMCSAVLYVFELVNSTYTLNILAIGLERYYAVCKPVKARFVSNRKRAYRMCLLTWIYAALFSSPHLFMRYQNVQYNDGPYKRAACENQTGSLWANTYYITIVSVFYLIPLIILIVLYLLILRRLKGPIEPNLNKAAMRHRRHVVKILATVIMAFFIFHLPSRVLYLIYFLVPKQTVSVIGVLGFKMFWFFAAIMLYLHSIVNLTVYNLMSKRFRMAFRKICCDICGLKNWRSGEESTSSTTS